MAEAKELKHLRSVLEQELDDQGAAAVLFVGLDRAGDFPDDPQSWQAFVQGGLREALEERLDTAEAARVAELAASVLTGDKLAPSPPDPISSTLAPTRELPRLEGPSKVLVVAGGSRLARTLKGALGSRVVPMAVGDASRVHAFVQDFEPGVLVVDLTDPVPALGPDLAKGLSPDGLVVLWGTGRDAKRLATALEEGGTRATVLDRAEGVPPLLELVRGAAS